MSKIARQILQQLAAINYLRKDNQQVVSEAIDRALDGKIISKSEVDALREESRTAYCLYCELEHVREILGQRTDEIDSLRRRNANQSTWLTEAWAREITVDSLKTKLWGAEQEIHDLKNMLLCNSNKYVLDNLIHIEKIEQLRRERDLLRSQIEQEKPAETVEPPNCLKPADAVNWTSTRIYGGSENASSQSEQRPEYVRVVRSTVSYEQI